MVYVCFIVLKSCFIEPFICSLYYKRFWYSGRVCYQSDNNNDILLRPGVYFALSVSCLFSVVLIFTISLESILPVIPSNGFPVLASSPSLGTPQRSKNLWGYYYSCHFFSLIFNFSLYFVRRTAFTFAPLFWKCISRAHYFLLKYFPVVWHIILAVIAKAKISGLASTYFYIWRLQALVLDFYIFFEGFLHIKILYPFPTLL